MLTYLRTLQRSLQAAPCAPAAGAGAGGRGASPHSALPPDAKFDADEAVAEAAAGVDCEAAAEADDGAAVGGAAACVGADAEARQVSKAERAQLSVEDEWKHVLAQVAALATTATPGHQGEGAEDSRRGRRESGDERGADRGDHLRHASGPAAGSHESQVLKLKFEITALADQVKQKEQLLACGRCLSSVPLSSALRACAWKRIENCVAGATPSGAMRRLEFCGYGGVAVWRYEGSS